MNNKKRYPRFFYNLADSNFNQRPYYYWRINAFEGEEKNKAILYNKDGTILQLDTYSEKEIAERYYWVEIPREEAALMI